MQRRWAGWSLIKAQGCGSTRSGGIKRRKFALLWRLKKLLLPRGATGAPSCSRQKEPSRRTELQPPLRPPSGLHSSCTEPDVSPFISYIYASRQTKEKELRLRLTEQILVFVMSRSLFYTSGKMRDHSYKCFFLNQQLYIYGTWSIPVFVDDSFQCLLDSNISLLILLTETLMRLSSDLNHILRGKL